MRKWPTFFIIGVDRGGTTSLYEYLKNIPEIFMSTTKEPWYFSPVVRSVSRRITGKLDDEKSYLNLFKAVKNETAVGEASAVYWRDPESAKLIHEKIPNAKIIISFRDPVDRFISGHQKKLQSGRYDKLIHESIQHRIKNNFTQRSRILKKESTMYYYDNLKRYLDIFEKNNILILIFEEWIKDPKHALEKILKFLNIDSSEQNFNNIIFEKHNASISTPGKLLKKVLRNKTFTDIARSTLPKSSRDLILKKISKSSMEKIKLDKNDKQLLIEFFYNDVKKLEKLLDRELPWPNFKNQSSSS